MADNPGDFLGYGWSFPLRVSSRGGLSLSGHATDIEEAIRIILSTAKGERHMRPEFGCGIHDLVFAPNDSTTAGTVKHAVENALEMWEPRIEIVNVSVDMDPERDTDAGEFGRNPAYMKLETGTFLLIDIHYKVRATNDERNLVYPFYLIRGE